MADLTIGEIGNILQVNLVTVDSTQTPPVQTPLDVTGATVTLLYAITAPNNPPKAPTLVTMAIINSTGGVVQYVFKFGDLAKPSEMGKNGVFRFSIRITYPNGNVLQTAVDGQLTIKDDSLL